MAFSDITLGGCGLSGEFSASRKLVPTGHQGRSAQGS
jgi:hypothetical protein